MTAGTDLAVLTRAFFARPAPTVAHELIGMVLCRPDEGLMARVVEVEAYTQDDPACHAFRGRTERNAPLWGPPGHAYGYRSYGMHWCFNAATGEEGLGQGCLIRAAQPVAGLETMRRRRPVHSEADLLRGPAKLCQAFDISGALSGSDLCGGGTLRFADDGTRPPVAQGPRVGVSLAADVPWRYFVPDSAWVSVYRRSPRAPRLG
ncbi:MAG TPA: DNA-3-methyladenine glycosylase [Euzebyales bacterium]|nr:DNA-3-methyladenine glycosylase [Euzebyales bacterium]